MFFSGRVSWHREEAISSIVSVEMVDLPVSRIQAQMEEEFGNQAGKCTQCLNSINYN